MWTLNALSPCPGHSPCLEIPFPLFSLEISFRVMATSSQKPFLIAWGVELVHFSGFLSLQDCHYLRPTSHHNSPCLLSSTLSPPPPTPRPRRGGMGAHNGCHKLWFILWLEKWEDVNLCWCPWSTVCWSAWESRGQFEANRREPWYKLYGHRQFLPSLTCLVQHQ